MNKNLYIIFFIFVFNFILKASTLYGISGFLRIPSAYPDTGISYFSFNSYSYYIFSKKMFLPNLEMSVKKRQQTDNGIVSFKLGLLPETVVTPALAVGILNNNDPELEKSYFIALSKYVRMLKARMHAGMIKEGNFKDAKFAVENLSLSNIFDKLVSNEKQEDKFYFGIEKSFFGLFDLLAGYRTHGELDAGIRLKLPGFKIEYVQLDLKDKENWKDNHVLVFSMGYRF